MSQEELKAKITQEALRICNERINTGRLPVPEPMMQSIQAQLTWLLEFFEGRSDERDKLHKLTFGHFAAREIEDADPELTDSLNKAYYVASRTASGLKVDLAVLNADA
jgi:hypothetical protein